jgi:hypothetical protein
MKAKMLNPYIKHGTLLWEFHDHVKTIDFPKLNEKQNIRK